MTGQVVINAVGSTARGVLVALLTYWLAIGRENTETRRALDAWPFSGEQV